MNEWMRTWHQVSYWTHGLTFLSDNIYFTEIFVRINETLYMNAPWTSNTQQTPISNFKGFNYPSIFAAPPCWASCWPTNNPALRCHSRPQTSSCKASWPGRGGLKDNASRSPPPTGQCDGHHGEGAGQKGTREWGPGPAHLAPQSP